MKNEYYFKILFGISLFSLGIIILFNDAFSEKDKDYLINYYYLDQFGGKGSGDGQFNAPHSIDIDKFGNIYVTDTGNNRVQKFTSDGKFVLKWGFENTGGKGAERTPHQLTVDSQGFVYLTDKNGHQILKFDENGKFIKIIGREGSGDGEFVRPHGIVFDSKDNMYITDMRNSRVQILDNDLNLIKQWGSYGNGTGQFSLTFPGIDYFEKDDLVFVVDKLLTRVQVFDNQGNFMTEFGSKGTGDGQFKRPEDLALNPSGKIFVSDTGNSRVQIFGIKE